MPQEGEPGWAGDQVTVYGLDATGDQVALCTVRLQGEVAVPSTNRFPEWETEGIVGRGQLGRVFPRDGQRFLDELPFAYRSAYLWAESG